MIYLLSTLILALVITAAIMNKLMDKWMVEYINMSPLQRLDLQIQKKWKCFNPLAKWENGNLGECSGKRAYNILFLKIGIKTRRFSDNCNEGWHFCKSVMITCLCLTMPLFMILGYLIHTPFILFTGCLGSFIIPGLLWNFTFNNYKSETFK